MGPGPLPAKIQEVMDGAWILHVEPQTPPGFISVGTMPSWCSDPVVMRGSLGPLLGIWGAVRRRTGALPVQGRYLFYSGVSL